ncbi:UDP-N-acetylmuramoyl-L-alanyl-D-glutamate--LD- lysine ligase [Bacteroidales bacterium Barb6XT]|nr:UDP-N-acetylmuramoyl-L-alanyl-D-glutamate--LD- lysine ligase [Bacteroidales bacterium Barb6XT]
MYRPVRRRNKQSAIKQTMQLSNLLKALPVFSLSGNETGMEITNICSDSRKVSADTLFVAVKGTSADGHTYIRTAIRQGAVAIVCESIPELLPEESNNVVFIKVKDSAEALGKLLSQWHDNPSEKLTLVGVTGTNGKTTVATLLYDTFRAMGHKTGLLSTVCNYIDDEAVPTEHTTPDPHTLQSLLTRMVEVGCTHVFMEVSSHSVAQKRISGLSFDGGIFTNLTRDHLDYHQTTENYLKAKKTFFDNLPATAFALTNADDKNGTVMLQNTAARKYAYSCRTLTDFRGKIMESYFEGTELQINGKEVSVHFTGRFNAYNLLAVYGAAVLLGKPSEEVLLVLSTLRPVSGRFETIPSPSGYTAIVDYAHTPDALTNVLNAIREVSDGKGRIITVVGAGGNRDKGKRPIMAKEAARLSDQVILTSDNPRFEDPDTIVRDMAAGLSSADLSRTLCITDRTQAIKTAAALARKGDVILVAGKGHEDYQEIQGVKHHFDDREKLRDIFRQENTNFV